MKVLLDEHLDHGLRRLLAPHEVVTVAYMGWAGLKNGELLRAAEEGAVDILLTGDQTPNHEQNLAGRRLAVVALSAIQLPIIRESIPAILQAIDRATPGSFSIVVCGIFTRRRKPAAIGLLRDTVEVIEHDPGWFAAAAEACRVLKALCGDHLVDVQHVGSTSVRGLPSKPILDLVAGVVTHRAVGELGRKLAGAGYIDRGDKADEGGHLFVVESAPNVRTVHLHVVEHASAQWRDYIRFRDILRRTPLIRERYAKLKRELAELHRADRTQYTLGKSQFIRTVLSGQEF